MAGTFEQVYAHAKADPEGFWAAAAEALDWDKKWDKVLDDSAAPFYRCLQWSPSRRMTWIPCPARITGALLTGVAHI